MLKKEVILVDKKDKAIGKEEKLKAHKEGKLHRAFSIFIFNSRFARVGDESKDSSSPFAGARVFDGNPKPDKNEAEGWKWIETEALKKDIKKNPERYTCWFKIILDIWQAESKNYTKSFV